MGETKSANAKASKRTPPASPCPGIRSKSEGVIGGNAIHLITPGYPPEAKNLGIQGKVRIEITIDEEGKVVSAHARCGHRTLAEAAENAARGSTFKPMLDAGVPIKISGELTYNFNLQ